MGSIIELPFIEQRYVMVADKTDSICVKTRCMLRKNQRVIVRGKLESGVRIDDISFGLIVYEE